MSDAAAQLADARLYLCTDARKRQGDLPRFLDAVLGGGVDIVQLRDKGMEAAEELEHLQVFADACRRHGKLLAVNDRADVAHAIGADVLHLGQGDLPVPAAFIDGDKVVKGLTGTLTLLRDDGFTDEEMLEWLFTPDPSLPGTPAQALSENRGTEVKRRAQALAV